MNDQYVNCERAVFKYFYYLTKIETGQFSFAYALPLSGLISIYPAYWNGTLQIGENLKNKGNSNGAVVKKGYEHSR
jgi:hypothetical protein